MITGQEYSTYGLEKKFFEMFEKSNGRYLPKYQYKLQEAIDDLESFGIKIDYEIINELKNNNSVEEIKEDKKMFTVELTGSPKNYGFKTKEEFLTEANKYAMVTVGKLDKNCNYLITDDLESTTAKMQKAEKLGVEIVDYGTFMSIIGG
jgi:NAD-dependent DNA ligase